MGSEFSTLILCRYRVIDIALLSLSSFVFPVFICLVLFLSAPPRLQALRNRESSGPAAVGAAIRNYALALAQDKSTTFAQNIENFIDCTRESRETNPQVSTTIKLIVCLLEFIILLNIKFIDGNELR